LLHVVEAGRDDHGKRVFLPVDRALLQRADHLGPGHRRGRGAQRLEGLQVDRVLHRAQAQAGHVGRRADLVAVVGDVAKALLAPAQRLEADLVELLQHVLPDGPVEDAARMAEVAEKEGDVEDAGIGDEIGQRAGRDDHRLDGAKLHALDHLALTAEAGGGEVAEDVAALGAFLDHLLPALGADAVMRIGGGGEGVADLDLGLRDEGRGEERGGHGAEKGGAVQCHEVPPGFDDADRPGDAAAGARRPETAGRYRAE